MSKRGGGRIEVLRGDITQLDVDAIVNAANEELVPGGGVCGAIHAAAGAELADACRPLAPCPTGDARITPGFGLSARHIVHAVGPVWRGGTRGEPDLLSGCYQRSLELVRDARLETVAFPCISTGIFGYPPAAAAEIAVGTVETFLADNDLPAHVVLCAFSEEDASILKEAVASPL